ncbi:MAG: hypothetical protein JWM47_334 [Acidimicrobiales bacterium]|nr:hypothetical protein [Acidimicrobiales bacterium]
MSEGVVREIVIIEPEDLKVAREIAAEHEVEVHEVEVLGIEPITTITLIFLGGSLAVGTVVYLLEKRKGGQIIDLRPGSPKVFYRSKDVVYGLVVILATDGKVTIEVKEPKGMFGEVIAALQGILTDIAKAGIEEISKAAKAALGDKATVNVEAVSSADPLK